MKYFGFKFFLNDKKKNRRGSNRDKKEPRINSSPNKPLTLPRYSLEGILKRFLPKKYWIYASKVTNIRVANRIMPE